MGHDNKHKDKHEYTGDDPIIPANIGEFGVAEIDSEGKVDAPPQAHKDSHIFDADDEVPFSDTFYSAILGISNYPDARAGAPRIGDTYIVGSSPSGDFNGQTPGKVATYTGSSWSFNIATLNAIYWCFNQGAFYTNPTVQTTWVDLAYLISQKEPAYSKNTAFNKNFGNGATEVCVGNDARLQDWSCSAKSNINQVIPNGLFTPVLLELEDWDSSDFHVTTPEDTGTATSGGANSLTDTGKSWGIDDYAGMMVRITGGTGAGQVRKIASNTATVLTISNPSWSTNPDATSTYEITLAGRLTVPTGKDGKYQVTPRLTFSGNATGIRGVAIYKNGTFFINAFFNPIGTVESTTALPAFLMDLAAGDYIEMYAYQAITAGTLNLLALGQRVYLQIVAMRGVA